VFGGFSRSSVVPAPTGAPTPRDSGGCSVSPGSRSCSGSPTRRSSR
jgi:hypothetical protein